MQKIIEKLKSQATWGLKFWTGVAFVLAAIFLLSLIYEIALQQYKVRHYIPTEAKILNSAVEWHRVFFSRRSSSSYRYKPKVEYSYEVLGHQYISSNITIINSNHTDLKWAGTTAGKYQPGKTVTAYYNPANPQKAFLIYEVAFWPYHYSLYWFVVLCVCATVYSATGKVYKKPKAPTQISGGYYSLAPDSIKRVILKVIVGCFFYCLVGLVLGEFYYSIAEKPYDLFSHIVFGVYFLLGVIPLGCCGYYAWQFRNFKSPEFLISQPDLRVGEKAKVKVIQKFTKAVDVTNIEMALVCTAYCLKSKNPNAGIRYRNDYIEIQAIHISNSILCKERNFLPGESLEYEDDILVPHGLNKSGFSGKQEDYPFHRWHFEIANSQLNRPVYKTRYFINCE
jgi:hypothetical protein